MQKQLALLLAVALGVASGCATSSHSVRLTDETSFDGLLRLKNPRFGAVWIAPDLDLSGYNKILLEGAGIEFRDVTNRGSRLSGGEFPLSESAKQRLQDIMADAFRSSLARSSQFELTEEPGPDVLTIWGGLYDVVSFVPPTPAGRGDIWLRSVGEATLVIELRDSRSNATLVRILDRRAAEQTGGAVTVSTVATTAEVRLLANRWARLFRQRLDQAPSLSIPADD
jgi:hypothetical protein